MNQDFPPLQLAQPVVAIRRKEPSRLMPTPPDVIARRVETARRLRAQIDPLATRLRSMSESERKAVFYKIEHDGPLDAATLGLKPIAEPTDRFTLAIPRSGHLDILERNVTRFEVDPVNRGMVPSAQLARVVTMSEGVPTDRLSQGLFDNYATLVGTASLMLEVELLSTARGENQRREELAVLRARLERAIGTSGTVYEHEEIKGTCRAVVRCSGEVFRSLVEGREWQNAIAWFEERPLFQTLFQTTQNFSVSSLGAFSSPGEDASIVCVVDTGVTIGNPFLTPVTRPDLVRSFLKQKPDDPTDEYGHGSGVASLVSYHALNIAAGGENQGRVWVASARVLDENNECEERLFSKVLQEVVETFVPLGVRIFNLSVNIRNRRWSAEAKRTVPRRSWVARRIDHLSREHDVIFVISAGNIDMLEVRDFLRSGQRYPAYLLHEEAALLDPAQAALALTVGSFARETTVVGRSQATMAIAEQERPSPFTRSGPGVRRETKPELVEYGGNYVFDTEGGNVRENLGCSVPVASHQLTPALKHGAGTSLSAPRVAHKLALVHQELRALGLEPSGALLRAFLVNSALLPFTENELESFVTSLDAERRQAAHVFGYGIPSADRATECDSFSVVMFHEGTLEANRIVFLDVPVPATLQSSPSNVAKQLTVTVVHTPDVQRWGLEEYLGTTLKWRMFRGDVAKEDVELAMSAPDEDGSEATDQPGDLPFSVGITQRSRGTVQHDTATWKRHNASFSDNHYTLAIAAFERWGRTTPEPVPFAVVVRLEETGRTVPIYEEVRNALVDLRVQSRARA